MMSVARRSSKRRRDADGAEAAASVGDRLQRWIDRHVIKFTAAVTGLAVAAWVISDFVPTLHKWLIDSGFALVLIIVLLLQITSRLVRLPARNESISVFANQFSANDEIKRLIENTRPRKAELLQFSAREVKDALIALRNCDAEIHLLIHDRQPDNLMPPWQIERTKTSLSDLFELVCREYAKLTVKAYTAPAAMRAMMLDDRWLQIGWYRYEADQVGVYGHDNALVIADCRDERVEDLGDTFRKAFDSLWKQSRIVHSADEWLFGGGQGPTPVAVPSNPAVVKGVVPEAGQGQLG